jgi:hypothetical protein
LYPLAHFQQVLEFFLYGKEIEAVNQPKQLPEMNYNVV